MRVRTYFEGSIEYAGFDRLIVQPRCCHRSTITERNQRWIPSAVLHQGTSRPLLHDRVEDNRVTGPREAVSRSILHLAIDDYLVVFVAASRDDDSSIVKRAMSTAKEIDHRAIRAAKCRRMVKGVGHEVPNHAGVNLGSLVAKVRRETPKHIVARRGEKHHF